MKNRQKNLGLISVTMAISLVSNIGFGYFDRVDAVPAPTLQDYAKPAEIPSSELYQVLKKRPRHPTISPQYPTISGEVAIVGARDDKQCTNLKVNLVSKENLPKPNDGGVHFDVPIFKYSQSLSGDLKTGKCNYSIGASLKDVGKKAWINFSGGDESGGIPSNSNITLPSGLIKINFDVGFYRAH